MTEQEKQNIINEIERRITQKLSVLLSSNKQEIINQLSDKQITSEEIFNQLRVLDSWNFTGVIQHITTAPTYIPRNKKEQIVLYDDGANRRVYFYVNGNWRYASLT